MPDVQPLEPTDPERLGAYQIVGRLGEGGQGVVYLGRPDAGGEPVAIKLFHAQLLGDPGALGTFARELEAAKQVARFCTAQVLDSGTLGSRRYIVSEYVDGPSLSQIVARDGPRTGSALDRLAIATATALVALHDAGVVHRDLKPPNVLIGADGPRVIDFGIARALSGTRTMVSRAAGTPAYMAPEQLEPGELSPAVDVFAWASTMVFAATGRPPFGNESIPVVFNRIAHGEPDLGGVEEPLRRLLAECLEKDPSRRPSAQDVLDRLLRRTPRPARTPAPLAEPPQERLLSPSSAESSREPPRSGSPEPSPLVPSPSDSPGPLPSESLVAPSPESSVTAAGVVGSSDGVTAPHPWTGRGRRRWVAAGAGVAAALVAVVVSLAFVTMADGDSEPKRTGAASQSPGGSGVQAAVGGSQGTREGPASSADGSAGGGPSAGGPSRSGRATPSKAASGSSSPSASKLVRVELGPGHFTAYCQRLGWEWVEYRESPSPGAYCVKRKGDTMRLTSAQLDAGCRWRYGDARARHFFKGKSNYCYAMKPAA
ncbi:serine/threonine protein kinase [Actinomadura fibrosa]|uniref:Serine/threonine protein kinase n=1 Tax=Actinomadura fibrosa TaxID=111802 RepID=A0ABW2XQG2_9ACTN|nr:protein kinase [Actinomadura fibrosa]